MRQVVFLVLTVLVLGCRIDLDTPAATPACVMSTNPVCLDAAGYQDFGTITNKILNRNCTGSSCHEESSSSMKARRLVFDKGKATAWLTLVNNPNDGRINAAGQVLSDIEQGDEIPLVDPGHPETSYLNFAMHGIAVHDFGFSVASPPPQVGFMPYSGDTLCCQKLDAVNRWITAGAPNDGMDPPTP